MEVKLLKDIIRCFSFTVLLLLDLGCAGTFVYGGVPYDEIGKTYPAFNFKDTYFFIRFPKVEELSWSMPESIQKSKKLESAPIDVLYDLIIEQDSDQGIWADLGRPALKYMTLNPEMEYWEKHCGFKLKSQFTDPYSTNNLRYVKFWFFPGSQYKIQAPSGLASFRFIISSYPSDGIFRQWTILNISNIDIQKGQTIELQIGTSKRELTYKIVPTDKNLPICKVDEELISIFGVKKEVKSK